MPFWKKKDKENKEPKKKKPAWREWLDAALFAIIAATIIRTFLFEAYTIPTGSMEGSMLVNDYLFVSKLAYGPRLPMTPLAVPLVHNSMPLFGGKSYIESVQWNYHRWAGFGNIKRYDVVVFNFPAGDTVMAERPADDYYGALKNEFNGDREAMASRYKIITRPIDKKENYIKRCVGLPGDKIEVREGVLYVNGTLANHYPHQKQSYLVQTKDYGISDDYIDENNIDVIESGSNAYLMHLDEGQAAGLRNLPQVVSVKPNIIPGGMSENGATFPHDTMNYKWSRDSYGPIIIPKQGATVNINPQNFALYRRVIRNYECNKVEEHDGKIFINGKESSSYTFKMDYFWMMGDNRHNSLDSRYWGYVPMDHIVGKAWFVWLSYGKHGLRWKRLFRGIHSLEE